MTDHCRKSNKDNCPQEFEEYLVRGSYDIARKCCATHGFSLWFPLRTLANVVIARHLRTWQRQSSLHHTRMLLGSIARLWRVDVRSRRAGPSRSGFDVRCSESEINLSETEETAVDQQHSEGKICLCCGFLSFIVLLAYIGGKFKANCFLSPEVSDKVLCAAMSDEESKLAVIFSFSNKLYESEF